MKSAFSVADLKYGQTFLKKKKTITQDNLARKAIGYVPYRAKNFNGISVHEGDKYYDNKPRTLELYVEYGGVCGAVSTCAAEFLRVKGVPGYPIGQPGHCAFIWRRPDGTWSLGNAIFGWAWSTRGVEMPWYNGVVSTILVQHQYKQYGHCREADMAYYASQIVESPQSIEFLLKLALSYNPHHLGAWRDYYKFLLEADTKSTKPKSSGLRILAEIREKGQFNPGTMEAILTEMLTLDPKMDAYTGCALLFPIECEGDYKNFVDAVYMRSLYGLITKDIPSLKKKFKYTAKNGKTFYKEWKATVTDGECTDKDRQQLCKLLERAIYPVMKVQESKGLELLDFYTNLLVEWAKPEFKQNATKFYVQLEKESDKEKVKAKVRELWARVAANS